MPFCNQCGSELFEGSKFCSQCGAAVPETRSQVIEPAQEQVANTINSQVAKPPAFVSEKKPFYMRGWFIAIVVIAVLAIIACVVIIGGKSLMRAQLESQPVTETLVAYGDFEETTVYGNGEDIIDIPCAGFPCLMDFEYEGVYHDYGYGYSYTGGVCAVYTIDKEGNKLTMLDHGIGPFSGTLTDWGVYETATALYIDADGDWSVTFRPMSTMGYAESGDSFTGSYVVAIDADAIREVSFTHDGSSNFIVGGVGTRSAEELVNTVGLFKGTIQWNQPKAFFVVMADGDWTIEWA